MVLEQYIVKYLTKELGECTFGKRRYFQSNNLLLPEVHFFLQEKSSLSEVIHFVEEYLPEYFDMVLLSSTSGLEGIPSGVMQLTFPIRAGELVSTVEMLLLQQERRLKKKKIKPKKRSEKEQKIIDAAKKVLMERNQMTEQEAFRYIQKSSMDSETNMVETAQMILLLIHDE